MYYDPLPIFKNFVEVELTDVALPTDRFLHVNHIERFPHVITRKDFLPCVIRDERNIREVVYVTGVNVEQSMLAVERGREGTCPQTWLRGAFLFSAMTAWSVQKLRTGGFAPVLDPNGSRPIISKVTNSTVKIAGCHPEIEIGMAARLIKVGGELVSPTDDTKPIYVSSVSIADCVTTVGLTNVVVSPEVTGIDIGMGAASFPAYTPDNVLADTVLATATGSITARSLADRFGDAVNVKDFGAVGDGTTDDAAAFEAAWTYANAHGGVVYVPYGTYKLSRNVAGEFISFGHVAFAGDKSAPVTDLFSDYVHLAGNETIAGKKTFSSSPVVPTPAASTSTNTEAINIAWYNEAIGELDDAAQPIYMDNGKIKLRLGDGLKTTGSSGSKTLVVNADASSFDANGKLIPCLPLAGGTMTGQIVTDLTGDSTGDTQVLKTGKDKLRLGLSAGAVFLDIGKNLFGKTDNGYYAGLNNTGLTLNKRFAFIDEVEAMFGIDSDDPTPLTDSFQFTPTSGSQGYSKLVIGDFMLIWGTGTPNNDTHDIVVSVNSNPFAGYLGPRSWILYSGSPADCIWSKNTHDGQDDWGIKCAESTTSTAINNTLVAWFAYSVKDPS